MLFPGREENETLVWKSTVKMHSDGVSVAAFYWEGTAHMDGMC